MAKNKNPTKKTQAPKKTTAPAPKKKAEAPVRFEPIADRDAAILRRFTDTAAKLRAAFDKGDGDAIRADFANVQAMSRDVARVVYIARRAGRRLPPEESAEPEPGKSADAESGADSLPEEDPDKTEG